MQPVTAGIHPEDAPKNCQVEIETTLVLEVTQDANVVDDVPRTASKAQFHRFKSTDSARCVKSEWGKIHTDTLAGYVLIP